MRYDTKKIVRISLIGIFVLLLCVFIFSKTRDSIFGARLTSLNISNGEVVTDRFLEIKGQMRNAAAITINDFSVAPGQDGTFSDPIVLQPGYNVIVIRTTDKFGKKMEKTYTLIYNDLATEPVEN